MIATTLLASHPGTATHLALLGIVLVVGLIVFAVVRIRNKREAAEAAEHEHTAAGGEHHRTEPHEHHHR